MEFAKELSLYFDVDFFGPCFANAAPAIPRDSMLSRDMLAFIGQYKFFFAFENSNCYDYVTEKFYRTLEACTIPVVIGAPNIEDFQPLPETIITVGDKSAAEIAKILQRIDEDDKLFEHYLRWKHIPKAELNPFFVHLWEKDSTGGAYCELCKLAHEKQNLPILAKPVRC